MKDRVQIRHSVLVIVTIYYKRKTVNKFNKNKLTQ